MKITVIHCAGSVGGWRWVLSVFGAIKKYYPENDITVYCSENVACPSDILEKMTRAGLSVKKSNIISGKFNYERKKFLHIKFIDNLINHILKRKAKATISKSMKSQLEADIIFNSWPYTTEPLNTEVPYLFIPHDFIFRHFFGLHCGNVYSPDWNKKFRKDLYVYLDNGCVPCVTSQYIANELKSTFPDYKGDINQVMVVLNNMQNLSSDEISSVMKKFDIKNDYILLATNDMHHKNMQAAISAYYYIKQKHPNIKMIICGFGTEGIRVKVNTQYYADHVSENEDYDIKSVGLISDYEISALMKNAKILLNVSLCEAGCGSGADAWYLGTPTAISDIPPYVEQVKTLGVKTEFFNPKNSEDVAAACLRLLDNPEYAQENARISQEALQSVYTEKDMADNYMNVFKKYVKE